MLSCNTKNGKIKVSRGSFVVLKARMKNRLYELVGRTVIGELGFSLFSKETSPLYGIIGWSTSSTRGCKS